MWLCYIVLSVFIIVIFYEGEVNCNDDANQHEFIIISLAGKNVDQVLTFSEVKTRFQEVVAALATNYCDAKGFQNYGVINSSTVEIHTVQPCPTEWPDSELCININMSIPINSIDKYELSAKNLYSMWKTHSEDQLKEIGVKEYSILSNSTILILWLCVTGVLFLLFCIILIFVLKTRCIENYLRSRKDVIGSSNRSWIPKYGEKQLVPPFFYPEPPRTKLEEAHIKYDLETNIRRRSFGIENPAYDHDISIHRNFEKQISQTTTIVDDFDSDDETIYPPSPLPRPTLHINEKRNNGLMGNRTENETTF